MKIFRGYVSKAQEGILSENPEAREYDSTPTLGEVRDRARANTLAWSLRNEDMGDKEATGDMGGRRDAGEKGKAPGAMVPEESTSHTSLEEGASGPFADMPSIPEMPGMPTDGMACARPGGWRLFSTRSLLIALVVNLCLVAAFLFLLRLERGNSEVVFYIDLVDEPAKTAANAEDAEVNDNAAAPAHDLHDSPDSSRSAGTADCVEKTPIPEESVSDAAPGAVLVVSVSRCQYCA